MPDIELILEPAPAVSVTVQPPPSVSVSLLIGQGPSGPPGPAGPTGPQGPAGAGADLHYVHQQSSASAVWTVAHQLGKRPAISVVDSAGDEVEGHVAHVDDQTAVLTFSAPFSGTAYCN